MNEKKKATNLKEYLQKKWELFKSDPLSLTLLAIIALSFFVRLWQIDSIPGGFSAKEADIVNTLLKVDFKHLWLEQQFYQGTYIYTAFMWTKIFGLSVLNLRILSAIIGSLTVLASYIFISQWFTKKVALFTSFLFAISSFHITLSRLILPEIELPLILLVTFITLTSAYRYKNPWLFAISGILIGVGFYTSPIYILIPFMFLVSGIYFYRKNPRFFTSYKHEIAISGIGFLGAILPFLVAFIRFPKSYLTYFGFNRSIWQIIMNIGQIPTLLFTGTPRNFFLNVGTEPLLDPFIFVTSIAGFFFSLFLLKRRKHFFLVVWLFFFVGYAALKRGVQILDLVGILPVIYVFSAMMLDYILDKWFKTFPFNKNARLLVIGIISIFFALSGLYNYDKYFVAYKNSRSVTVEFLEKPPIPLK